MSLRGPERPLPISGFAEGRVGAWEGVPLMGILQCGESVCFCPQVCLIPVHLRGVWSQLPAHRPLQGDQGLAQGWESQQNSGGAPRRLPTSAGAVAPERQAHSESALPTPCNPPPRSSLHSSSRKPLVVCILPPSSSWVGYVKITQTQPQSCRPRNCLATLMLQPLEH